MRRPIAISLSPNLEGQDVWLAIKLILSPLQFFGGSGIKLLEQWFRQYFGVSYAVSFASGRGALYAILKSMGIKAGDEVLLQSFTCVAVPNAVIATGAKPIYVDIDSTLVMDIDDLEKKISKKTKAVIVQHNFGIPSRIVEIIQIAKKRKLVVIEDCAHTIGGVLGDKKLGKFGDAAFFSFGRDKAFSTVFGGMAITNNKIRGSALRQFQRRQEYPGFFWTIQQLLHPIAFAIILPLYDTLFLGKILLVVFQKFQLLGFPVLKEEKEGKTLPIFIKKLPNVLALLAIMQLKRIDKFNAHRMAMVDLYLRELRWFYLPFAKSAPLLRFPLIVDRREEMISFLRKRSIYVGKWYSEIIDPKGVDFRKIFYQRGSCPNAELIAKKIINLPTYPTLTLKEAKKVVAAVKDYAKYSKN